MSVISAPKRDAIAGNLYLDLAAFDAMPLQRDPFDHIVLRNLINPRHLGAILDAFPDVPGPGSHSPAALKDSRTLCPAACGTRGRHLPSRHRTQIRNRAHRPPNGDDNTRRAPRQGRRDPHRLAHEAHHRAPLSQSRLARAGRAPPFAALAKPRRFRRRDRAGNRHPACLPPQRNLMAWPPTLCRTAPCRADELCRGSRDGIAGRAPPSPGNLTQALHARGFAPRQSLTKSGKLKKPATEQVYSRLPPGTKKLELHKEG